MYFIVFKNSFPYEINAIREEAIKHIISFYEDEIIKKEGTAKLNNYIITKEQSTNQEFINNLKEGLFVVFDNNNIFVYEKKTNINTTKNWLGTTNIINHSLNLLDTYVIYEINEDKVFTIPKPPKLPTQEELDNLNNETNEINWEPCDDYEDNLSTQSPIIYDNPHGGFNNFPAELLEELKTKILSRKID